MSFITWIKSKFIKTPKADPFEKLQGVETIIERLKQETSAHSTTTVKNLENVQEILKTVSIDIYRATGGKKK